MEDGELNRERNMNKQSIKKRFEKQDFVKDGWVDQYSSVVWNFISKEIDKAVKEEREKERYCAACGERNIVIVDERGENTSTHTFELKPKQDK